MTRSILQPTLMKMIFVILVFGQESYGMPYVRKSPQKRYLKSGSGDKVVFPSNDDSERVQGQLETLKMITVPSCQYTTYCEKPSYYPNDLVDFAVERDDKYKYFAPVDEVADSDTDDRIDLMDEVPICASIIQVVYPKTAESRYKRWLFVINHKNFMQGVRIEECRHGNSRILSNTPDGYETSCKQLYAYRRLSTVLPDGKIELEPFRFPSGCRGYLKTADSDNRFG